MGQCYDTIQDDGTGCYSEALTGLCATDYAACTGNSECAALDYCLKEACAGLTGVVWETCSENCREECNAAGMNLYNTWQQCIYCDACAVDCAADAAGKGCEYPPGSCVDISTACYGSQPDGSPQCWGCAMQRDCKTQVNACKVSAACTNLESCLVPCNSMTGTEWQTCTDACKTANPGGVTLLAEYYSCIWCDAGCGTAFCPADAAGKCL